MNPRLGAVFPTGRPIADLPGIARALERLGYDELWVVEDCFAYGGMTAAATALAQTHRLVVGLGLLPATVRNPAIAAMELATLATLHPRRLRAAVGHGVEPWMRQIGARPRDRMAALREVTEALLGLLRGDTVTLLGGFVSLDRVTLEHPPEFVPPILIGTTGARGIALAAQVADGIILPEGASPAAVSAVARMLRPRSEITVYTWMRIDDDHDAARDTLLPSLTRWRDGGLYPALQIYSGLPEGGPLSREHVDGLALAGGPERCAAGIAALARAGAASVVAVPVGDDQDGQLDRFATEVFPHVLAGSL